nr:glutamate-gated chloride channel alpha-like [Procambarus clarkii]
MFHGEETELRVSRAEMVVFMCNMDLFFYPFDIQVCRIPLRLRSHRVDDVRWNTSRVEAAVSNHFLLTLFDVVHLSVSVPDQHHDTVSTSLIFPTLTMGCSGVSIVTGACVMQAVVVVKLARKYGAYIFNTILPCIVLEIIGFLTHAFPTDDFSNRSTATLSCLIVKAAFFIQISTTLPPSAEPKLVDVWMFGNVSVLTLIFVVHVAVLCVHQQQQQYSLRHQPGEHQYLVDHHHHPGKHRQDLAHMDNPKAVGRLPSIAWHKETSPNTTFLPRVINFVGFLLSFFSCGVLICAMYVTVTRARNAALLQ